MTSDSHSHIPINSAPARPVLLKTCEACEALGVSRVMLHNLRRQGMIAGVKVGQGKRGQWRFLTSSIDEFVAGGRTR